MQPRPTLRQIPTPPRHLPSLLLVHLLVKGPLAQMGWGFAAFGTLLAWIFVSNSTLMDLPYSWHPREKAVGRMVAVYETGASENNARIWAYDIRVRTDAGPIQVTNYGFGGDRGDSIVAMTFPAGHPERAVAEGLRSRSFDGWVGFVLVFPLVGYLLAGWQARRGWRHAQLLRWGEPAEGTYVDEAETGTTVNGVPQMAVRYTFAVQGTTYEAKARAMANRISHLWDEPTELILYHPQNPAQNLVVDEHAATLAFDDHGQVRSPGLLAVLFSLILPLATLALVGFAFA